MKIEKIKIVDEHNQIKDSSSNDLTRAVSVDCTFNKSNYKFEADKSKDQLFIPIVSKSSEEVILFLKNFPQYSPPCNLIILNGDSTVRFNLCPPQLISEQYTNYESKAGKVKAEKSKYFIQPDLYESVSSNSIAIWIGFGIDWYEVRELDLKTGVFGKCLSVARL